MNLNLIYKTLWTGARSGLLISMLEKVNWFCLTSRIAPVLFMWKWIGLFSSFKMLGLPFSSQLDLGSYIISTAKTTSKKIGDFIHFMKYLSPEVALYIYKSTIQPSLECCCHVLTNSPSCYLELLDKLQKLICRTVGPSFAAPRQGLAHRWNVVSLSLFYWYYFSRFLSELAQLVLLVLLVLLNWLFSKVTRISLSTVSFIMQLGSGILCLQNAFFWPMI